MNTRVACACGECCLNEHMRAKSDYFSPRLALGSIRFKPLQRPPVFPSMETSGSVHLSVDAIVLAIKLPKRSVPIREMARQWPCVSASPRSAAGQERTDTRDSNTLGQQIHYCGTLLSASQPASLGFSCSWSSHAPCTMQLASGIWSLAQRAPAPLMCLVPEFA